MGSYVVARESADGAKRELEKSRAREKKVAEASELVLKAWEKAALKRTEVVNEAKNVGSEDRREKRVVEALREKINACERVVPKENDVMNGVWTRASLERKNVRANLEETAKVDRRKPRKEERPKRKKTREI